MPESVEPGLMLPGVSSGRATRTHPLPLGLLCPLPPSPLEAAALARCGSGSSSALGGASGAMRPEGPLGVGGALARSTRAEDAEDGAPEVGTSVTRSRRPGPVAP